MVLLLAGAILVNLGQFRAVDQQTIDNFDAVHRNDTADLFELSQRECQWCRDRYALHLALGATAPGSTVIVPASSPYAASRNRRESLTLRLYALGRVTGIEWVSYRQAPGLLSATGLDPSPHVTASGPGGEKGAPWALAPDPSGQDPHRRFVLLQWDGRDLLLEASLLPHGVPAELAP